jgi:hypothetical protein
VTKKFVKRESSGESAVGLSLIKNVYQDAIEYTAVPGGTRGMLSLLGVFGAAMMAVIAYSLYPSSAKGGWGAMDNIMAVCALGFFAFGLFIVAKYIRVELFSLADQPVIFDRKNKKIYRVFQEVKPGFLGLFRRWPIRQAEYDCSTRWFSA